MKRFIHVIVFLFSLNAMSEQIFYETRDFKTLYIHVFEETPGKQWRQTTFLKEKKYFQVWKRTRFLTNQQYLSVMSQFQDFLRDSKIDEILQSKPTYANNLNQIWESKNAWNWEWEKKYSEWISQEINKDFFIKYQISTDCADVAVALRWIFSRIHYLPAGNSLVGSGVLFTNSDFLGVWSSLPTSAEWYQDLRFLAALEYIMQNTFTHTVFSDHYPIKISLDTLMPGTVHILLRENSGHTTLLQGVAQRPEDMVKGPPIRGLSSTIPREIRPLAIGFSVSRKLFVENKEGIIRPRWPEKINDRWTLRQSDQMPFFSKEQYSADFIAPHEEMMDAILRHLYITINWRLVLRAGFQELQESIDFRKAIVEKGYAICSNNNCYPGTENYENYSTPSRDSRLWELLHRIQKMYLKHRNANPEIEAEWSQLISRILINFDKYSMNFTDFYNQMQMNRFSHDPRDRPSARWGLAVERGAYLTASNECVSESPGMVVRYYDMRDNDKKTEYLQQFDFFPEILRSAQDGVINFNWGDQPIGESAKYDYVGISFDAFLKLDREQDLVFQLDSDDGSRLMIDRNYVILNDQYTEGLIENSTVRLEAGFHRITLKYFENGARAHLVLKQKLPSGELVDLDSSKIFQPCPISL